MSQGAGIAYQKLSKLKKANSLSLTDLLFISNNKPEIPEKSTTFQVLKDFLGTELQDKFEPVTVRTVIVTDESQLPDVLEANTTYDFRANIIISRDLTIPAIANSNINFSTPYFNHISITYTGSGTFLTGVGIDFFNVFRLNLINAGTGTLINVSPSANPIAQISLTNVLVLGWNSIGTWSMRYIITNCAFVNCNGGLNLNNVIDGRFNQLIIQNFSNKNSTFITFGGTSKSSGVTIGLTATTFAGETALKFNNSIGVGSVHKIESSSITGTGTALDPAGLNQKDKRLVSKDTTGIPNSVFIGAFSVSGNAATTSPGDVNNFVDVVFSGGGLVVDSTLSERVSVTNTANGEQTYNGIDPETFVLSLKLSGTSGTANKLFGVKYVIDRGAGYIDLPDNSVEEEEFTNKLRTNVFTDTILLCPGDKIKPQVANTETNGVTYVFSAAKQQVHKVG